MRKYHLWEMDKKYLSGFATLHRMLIWLLLVAVAYSCAQQARPQGGPRDETPPTVIESDPIPGELNFDREEVTFTFSEPIRKPTYDKEIFISPFITPPEIRLADSYRKVTIRFREELRPATTYIITLNEIKDNTEGNPLEEPYVLAFSTGDQLDSLSLEGKILKPTLGEVAEDLTILLFDADSAVHNNFYEETGLRKRPTYLTQTNDKGEFEFQYLREGPYRVIGMENEVRGSGLIAVSLDTVVYVKSPVDSTEKNTVSLMAFVQDEEKAPTVLRYKFWSESVLDLSISENIVLSELSGWTTDTLGNDSTAIGSLSLYKGERGPRLLTQVAAEAPFQLHLAGLMDSLGYSADTALRINYQPTRPRVEPWLEEPTFQIDEEAWKLLVPATLFPAQLSEITLSDTTRNEENRQYFPLDIRSEGFYLLISPSEELENPLAPYILRVPGSAMGLTDSLLGDSVFVKQVKWYDPAAYGSLSGTVRLDTGYQGPILVQILDENKKAVATFQDTTFSLAYLKEGTYSFRVLLDQDGNGVYTPGSLWPPSWPERTYLVPETVKIRGNWTFEDHVVKVISSDDAIETEPEDEEVPGDETERPPRPGQGPPRN